MKRRKNGGWRWSCNWSSSYFGCMHADYEGCDAHGRKKYATEREAYEAGKKHMEKHGYHGTSCNCHSHNVSCYQE